jgi:hypothetical protein
MWSAPRIVIRFSSRKSILATICVSILAASALAQTNKPAKLQC